MTPKCSVKTIDFRMIFAIHNFDLGITTSNLEISEFKSFKESSLLDKIDLLEIGKGWSIPRRRNLPHSLVIF